MRTLFGRTQYLVPSRFLSDLPAEVVEKDGSVGSAWGARPYGAIPERRATWDDDAPPPAPRTVGPVLAPGERVVDYDAFDDVSDDASGFAVRPGTHVFHKRFGKGVVKSVEAGAPPTVLAHFPGFGPRKVRADYLSFE
jgi:hypothetical protein